MPQPLGKETRYDTELEWAHVESGSPFQAGSWAGRPASLHHGFYGREDDLRAIASAFEEHRAVIVSGGVGSGKSRLAAEYSHQTDANEFWTTGEVDAASIFTGLAPALGVIVEGKNAAEIAGEVQRRLSVHPPETLWVVDNLTDLELANSLINASGSVRLLITTRDSRRHILPATVAFHCIEVLETDDAIALLCSRSESFFDDPALAKITEKVGRLPLALEVLSARLGEPRQNPEKVLAQLDHAPTVVQMETFQKALGASIPRAEGLFSSINGTLEDLGTEDREALAGLAYVADAPVPEALGAALMGVDDEELARLLSNCSRQSVLSWRDGQVRIHALTVDMLAATSPDGSLAVALDRASGRLELIARDDPIALRGELVHYEAMHFHAREHLEPEEESILGFRNSLALGYRAASRYEDAIKLQEETLEVRERVQGPEHPNTLTSRNNLATSYVAAGRVEDAISIHEEILEARERVVGPEHPDTLATRNNLATSYAAAGRIEDAIRLHEETLEVSERVQGPEHPDTLTSRNNLATGYRDAGRVKDAIRLDEETLEVSERVQGPEHPDTLTSRNNLATGYRDAGRVEDAIRLHEETLEARERVLGPEHPDTLTSRGNLATGYRDAGRVEDAIRLDEETLEVSERVQGPEHPSTLTSRNNLATSYHAAGRVEDAISLHKETLEIRERVLGPEHPNILTSRNNLATGYRDAGRVEDAIRLDEETLEMMEHVLGPEHPGTLTSRNNLATSYHAAGRVEDAIRLHEETLEIRERVLGPEHPNTLTSRSNLATGYRDAGRIEDANKLEEPN